MPLPITLCSSPVVCSEASSGRAPLSSVPLPCPSSFAPAFQIPCVENCCLLPWCICWLFRSSGAAGKIGGLLSMQKMTQESSLINSCLQFVPISVVLFLKVEGQKVIMHNLAYSGVCFLRLSPRWLQVLPTFPLDLICWYQIPSLLLETFS